MSMLRTQRYRLYREQQSPILASCGRATLCWKHGRRFMSEVTAKPTRANSTRQRILVAIAPSHRGLPLAASRGLELAQAAGSEILLVSVVFDSIVARGFQGAEAL